MGDFEIDLAPFFMENYEKNNFTSALRNHKEFRKRPTYMSTDMRKKGEAIFNLTFISSIKKYID